MKTARTLLVLAALLGAAPALAAKKALPSGERIDVNRAPVVQLMRLPGVGRKKAEAMVAQRVRTPFRSLEDLLVVKGVSPSWIEKNRAHLALGTASAAPAAPKPVARK